MRRGGGDFFLSRNMCEFSGGLGVGGGGGQYKEESRYCLFLINSSSRIIHKPDA